MPPFSQNQSARFQRMAINGGKHTSLAPASSDDLFTVDPKTVAIRFANDSAVTVYLSFNGAPAVVGADFPVFAGQDSGWIDIVGGWDIHYIATSLAALQVLELLDQ